MSAVKSQYIKLANGSTPRTDRAEVKYSLESQEVRVSGRCRGWSWIRPSKGAAGDDLQGRRIPLIDFNCLLDRILDAVSLVLAAFGVLKRYATRGGGIED